MAAQQSSQDTSISTSFGDETQRLKKKVVLVGPAIDSLVTQVSWDSIDSRLSSSLYATLGVNLFLRKFSFNTQNTKADFDFVIWQLSPNLSPSLLKRFLLGASAIIVAVETQVVVHQEWDDALKALNTGAIDKGTTETQNDTDNHRLYISEDSACKSLISTLEGKQIDIVNLDKYANCLKLPITFIHCVKKDRVKKDRVKKDDLSIMDSENGQFKASEHSVRQQSLKDKRVTLRETEHSLHVSSSSDSDIDLCLDQVFSYIASHFAHAA